MSELQALENALIRIGDQVDTLLREVRRMRLQHDEEEDVRNHAAPRRRWRRARRQPSPVPLHLDQSSDGDLIGVQEVHVPIVEQGDVATGVVAEVQPTLVESESDSDAPTTAPVVLPSVLPGSDGVSTGDGIRKLAGFRCPAYPARQLKL